MLSANIPTFDTSSTPPESSCSCFSLLVGFFGFILTMEFLHQRVPHLLRFPFRHLHKIRHHPLEDSIHHESINCQWDMFVQIPEFPSSSLISSFPDLRDQFSMFYPCVNLGHLGSHLWFLWTFLWILPCFLYSCSWTMTCSVCPCQTIACLCSCVHCRLVENVLHRTLKKNTHHADSMTLFLCQTRERVDRVNICGI